MNNEKLNQNLDKVAYGVAGLLSLALLALPFFVGGGVAETSQKLVDEQRELYEKMREQQFPTVVPALTAEKIDEQWDVGQTSRANPGWVTDIAPVLIRKIEKKANEYAQHEPPVLSEIACIRDAEAKRVGVRATGRVSAENEFVTIRALELQRKHGEDGGFVKVAESEPGPDGTATFTDFGVTSGESYFYQLVSIARRSDDAPEHILPPQSLRQTSNELGPTPPMPYDLSLRIYAFQGDAAAGSPSILGKVVFWDYEAGEAKEVKRGQSIHEREPFGNGRYEIFPIDNIAKVVTVRDLDLRAKETFEQRDKDRPVESWEAMTYEPPPEPEEDETLEGFEEAEEEEAEPEAPRRGFRRFGR